jgi:hypothetical protein
VSLELVMALREAAPSVLSSRSSLLREGDGGEVFAVGAKLRRVGPMTTASGAYCIGGARDAAVVWAGGLHSGWNARMRAGWGSARRFRQRKWSVPPFGEQFSLGFWGREMISVAIQAPSLGRERPLVARPECVTTGDAFLVVPEVGGGTALAIDTCLGHSPLRVGLDPCSPRRRGALGTVWLGGRGCFICGGPVARASSEPSGTTRTEGVEG